MQETKFVTKEDFDKFSVKVFETLDNFKKEIDEDDENEEDDKEEEKSTNKEDTSSLESRISAIESKVSEIAEMLKPKEIVSTAEMQKQSEPTIKANIGSVDNKVEPTVSGEIYGENKLAPTDNKVDVNLSTVAELQKTVMDIQKKFSEMTSTPRPDAGETYITKSESKESITDFRNMKPGDIRKMEYERRNAMLKEVFDKK